MEIKDKESPTKRYERIAAEFFKETGYMAPGKDVPAALGGDDPEVRDRIWLKWLGGKQR